MRCFVIIAALFTSATSNAAIAQENQTFIPIIDWVRKDQTLCGFTRSFSFQKTILAVTIEPDPLYNIASVRIEAKLRAKLPSTGTTRVRNIDGVGDFVVPYRTFPSQHAGGIVVSIDLTLSQLSTVSNKASFTAALEGGPTFTVALGDLSSPLQMANACKARLLPTIGFTPDPSDAPAVTRPDVDPIIGRRQWIETSDYPIGIKPGRVVIGWIIGKDGRVHNCRGLNPVGDPRLHIGACAALEKRAQYIPARDAAGNPVPYFAYRMIVVR